MQEKKTKTTHESIFLTYSPHTHLHSERSLIFCIFCCLGLMCNNATKIISHINCSTALQQTPLNPCQNVILIQTNKTKLFLTEICAFTYRSRSTDRCFFVEMKSRICDPQCHIIMSFTHECIWKLFYDKLCSHTYAVKINRK